MNLIGSLLVIAVYLAIFLAMVSIFFRLCRAILGGLIRWTVRVGEEAKRK